MNKISNLERFSKPRVVSYQKSKSSNGNRSPNGSFTAKYCKICKHQTNHSLAYCPQLSPADRSQISKVRNVASSIDELSLEDVSEEEYEATYYADCDTLENQSD